MTHPLKPYPAYRDSGSPWLGEVPEHWEVLPNRAMFTEVNEQNHPDEQMLSVTIANGVIRQHELLEDSSKKDGSRLDKTSYKLVRIGDIAYNKMRAWQGAIGVSEHRGIISPAYIVQRPLDSTNSHYMHYLLRTAAFSKEAERHSYGIAPDMWSLRPEHFKTILVCAPPPSESAAIVRYLDHACERIGLYIGAKKRLIALLRERKKAIIDRTVTRGLDPNAPMKPTGIAWMPEAPAHWEMRRLKSCVADVVDMTNEREPGDIYVALEHVESWTGKIVDMDFDTTFESQVKRFRSDDVLFGKLRPYLAKSARPDRSGVCVGEFLVLRPGNDNLLSGYLEILLRSKSVVDAIDASTFGAKMPRADWQFIGNMRFPIPPVSEQAAIVERLERSTAAIDTAIGRARRQIDLLREYRERLINDVVTGKLDVREARVAAAPDADAPQESGQAPSHRAEAGAPAIP